MTALRPLDIEPDNAAVIVRQHSDDGTAALVLTPREVEEVTERLFELMTKHRRVEEMAALLNRLNAHLLKAARRQP